MYNLIYYLLLEKKKFIKIKITKIVKNKQKLYENALGTIGNMNLVVDKLFEKSK